MVAGRKEDDNTFTGVIMGDWSGDDGAEKTIGDETHTYGVKFEQAIPELYDLLKTF